MKCKKKVLLTVTSLIIFNILFMLSSNWSIFASCDLLRKNGNFNNYSYGLEKEKNILILNSYHLGDEWEDSLYKGIQSQFINKPFKINLLIEYMDSRRFWGKENDKRLFEFYKEKYKNSKLDVVICCDNYALEFLRKYHNILFKGVPIVFCGINNFNYAMIDGDKLFTGITEETDMKGNINIALKLHPNTKNIYMITSDNLSAIENTKLIKKIQPLYNEKVKFYYLSGDNIDALIKQIKKLPSNSIIFIIGTFMQNKNTYIQASEGAEILSRNTNIPIYGLWSFLMNHGIIGGDLCDGKLHGIAVARIVLKVLSGNKPENIKVIKGNTYKQIFDYNQLIEKHIEFKEIPKNANMVNKPINFYTFSKLFIWISIYALFGILLLIIEILHQNIRKRKYVEKQLKGREEQLLALINSLPDIICFRDENGKWIEANNAAIKAYNLKASDYKDRTDEEIYSKRSDLKELFEKYKGLNEGFSDDKSSSGSDKIFHNPNDDKIYNFIKVPVFKQDGSKSGLVIIGRDVTEEKKGEENRKKLDEAIEYDKVKTEFFANISHEFRTPLNVIFTTTQLFEVYLKNQSIIDNGINLNKKIYILKQNCFRLLRLVNNLIDITKIDSGYLTLKLANYNIVEIIEDITLSVAEYIESKGIGITFDTDIEEKYMPCDADKIERIILNLLSNSVKFTKPGGSIFVNIHDNDKSVIISVRDTGVGISKENQGIIFQRFRQVDKSLTRSNEGSGIGLSLVESLVEMHKGNIKVRSELGQGTEFIIELPVEKLLDNKIEETPKEQNYIERINIEFSDIYS